MLFFPTKAHAPAVLGAGVLVLVSSCFSNNSGTFKAGPSGGGPSPDSLQTQIDLGRKIMFDARLSQPQGIACGTCHDPNRGWTDERPQGKGVQDHTLDTAGHDGTLAVRGNYFKTILTGRNTPTIYNAHLFPNLFWDLRASDLAHQSNFPFEGFKEMNSSWVDHILPLMSSDPVYVQLFDDAYGPGQITQDNATAAIGEFEKTISVFDTPYDEFLAGNPSALTQLEKDGHDLFFGAAGCATCHPGPNLTDTLPHNTGVPNAGTFALTGQIDHGYGKRTDLTTDPPTVYDDPDGYCKFKTPQLRMLAVTGPYMHNGAFQTLEEVVDFYDAGGGPDLCGTGTKDPAVAPLGLSQNDKDALVAFLRTGLLGTEIK